MSIQYDKYTTTMLILFDIVNYLVRISLPSEGSALFFTDALTACCHKRKEKIQTVANEVSDRLLFAVKPNSRSRTSAPAEESNLATPT